ncbi:PrgI family protein [Patescibacteria group bacterium]|nr:PrgI family protein [Patescibacteria group bacterium]MBU1931825.1 PrgI family protein [Patescibacteria group bacterium]
MEDHPIPQNISAYQFRLVGSMTLKQFLELAGGIIIAWILISSKLNALIKWPLSLLSGLFGAGLAFFPIEERPLDQWLINFIRSIYSPTQFIWHQSQPLVKFLQPRKALDKNLRPLPNRQKTNSALESYLKTLPNINPHSPLDQAEASYLSRVQALFSTIKPKQEDIVIKHLPMTKPAITGIKVRRLMPLAEAKKAQQPRPLKAIDVPIDQAVKIGTSTKPMNKQSTGQTNKKVIPSKPTPVIKTKPVQSKGKIIPVKFVPQLPLPYKPKEPNLIVGMVFDAQDHILINTIIEIKDAEGNPVRALKTNRLGQFSIATPLKNGRYLIEAEHTEKHFDIMSLEAKGKIIPPIEIRSYD